MTDLYAIAKELRDWAALAHGTPPSARVTRSALLHYAQDLEALAGMQRFTKPLTVAQREAMLEGCPARQPPGSDGNARGQSPQMAAGARKAAAMGATTASPYADPASGWLMAAVLALFCGTIIVTAVALIG